MTAAQLKSAEMLSPFLGGYLATKIAQRLSAVLCDNLRSAIIRERGEAFNEGRRKEAEQCRTASGSAGSPATRGMSGK